MAILPSEDATMKLMEEQLTPAPPPLVPETQVPAPEPVAENSKTNKFLVVGIVLLVLAVLG